MTNTAEEKPKTEPLPKAGAFWSDRTIRARLCMQGIIAESDYRDDRVEGACYILSVGDEIYISPSDRRSKETVKKLKDGDDSCVIPPGQFAFILTKESICIPHDVLAFITMRMKPKYRGLVNVSGFQVDPGFNGKLVFAIFNAGPSSVHVRRGEAWFSIYFADLDQFCREGWKGEDRSRIPSSIINSMATGHVLTFEGLKSDIDALQKSQDQRVSALERDVAIVKWAALLILGAAIPLIIQYFKGH